MGTKSLPESAVCFPYSPYTVSTAPSTKIGEPLKIGAVEMSSRSLKNGKLCVNYFRDQNLIANKSEIQSAYDVTKASPHPTATNVRFMLRKWVHALENSISFLRQAFTGDGWKIGSKDFVVQVVCGSGLG